MIREKVDERLVCYTRVSFRTVERLQVTPSPFSKALISTSFAASSSFLKSLVFCARSLRSIGAKGPHTAKTLGFRGKAPGRSFIP